MTSLPMDADAVPLEVLTRGDEGRGRGTDRDRGRGKEGGVGDGVIIAGSISCTGTSDTSLSGGGVQGQVLLWLHTSEPGHVDVAVDADVCVGDSESMSERRVGSLFDSARLLTVSLRVPTISSYLARYSLRLTLSTSSGCTWRQSVSPSPSLSLSSMLMLSKVTLLPRPLPPSDPLGED